MNIHRVSELWGLMYELGNRVGTSWRLRYELEKQAATPNDFPKCTYKATGESDLYSVGEQPAEYCETEPVSTDMYKLRLYWLCRQHAALKAAEEEWGNSISELLEWELVLDEARKVETKEEIVALLERKCDDCEDFSMSLRLM